MRALILAAGLGRRLAPLSDLRPKPSMPVRGIPVIGYLLALLKAHGFDEVVVNLHHLPEILRSAVEAHTPAGLHVSYSEEEKPLGTGGALRRTCDFLRESDPCLVMSGDMLLDLDLTAFVALHRERENLATLALREDPREALFGTIGTDAGDRLRRIGNRFDLGQETSRGVFMGVRAFAPQAFDSLPDREVFEDLTDWLAPRLVAGAGDIQATRLTAEQCIWEPVGTPQEYLQVNLQRMELPFINAEARAVKNGTRIGSDLIVGANSQIQAGAQLERCVVWDGEVVPSTLRATDGVFAGGRFHSCAPVDASTSGAESAS